MEHVFFKPWVGKDYESGGIFGKKILVLGESHTCGGCDQCGLKYSSGCDEVNTIKDMDAVVLAVAHDCFKELSMDDIDNLYGEGKKIMIDIKGLLDRKAYEAAGYEYWRL